MPDAPRYPDTYRAPSFSDVYANYISSAVSRGDLTLVFGHTIGEDQPIEQRVAVTLSPQTAKAMLQRLQQDIDAYEHRYGVIRTP